MSVPNTLYSAKPVIPTPTYSSANYSIERYTNLINQAMNNGSNLSGVNAYTHGATVTIGGYGGGVYSPTQNRIYMVPRGQGSPGNVSWHYIDCNTGNVVAYPNPAFAAGTPAGGQVYVGGAYSPTQNRIYFAPRNQAEANALYAWHYIDCNVDSGASMVGTYPNPLNGVTDGYVGAVYSPTQNRIYFVPRAQATQPIWHYIDCNTGLIGTYPSPNNVIALAYSGGIYSPTQYRIYFTPNGQAAPFPAFATEFWHYIDCNTGTVGTYLNPNNAISTAYFGGVYSPTQNRIYFAPFAQGAPYPTNPNTQFWHYIDCNTGLVGTYLNPNNATATSAYTSGCYSPTQNRIYFSPASQANQPLWHYIDCNTGTVGTYTAPSGSIVAQSAAYIGCTYSPTQNRIYFFPQTQSPISFWHYLDMQSNYDLGKIYMARAEFNKL